MSKTKRYHERLLGGLSNDEGMAEIYEEIEVETLKKAELFDEGLVLIRLFKAQCIDQDTYDLICDHLAKCCSLCDTACGYDWCSVGKSNV